MCPSVCGFFSSKEKIKNNNKNRIRMAIEEGSSRNELWGRCLLRMLIEKSHEERKRGKSTTGPN